MIDICFYLTHNAVNKTYKFFFLAEKLRKLGFSVRTILCNTEKSGVQPGEFTEQQLNDLPQQNIFIYSKNQMKNHLLNNTYKYFIVGCYSGGLSEIIGIAKKNGSLIIEIATIGYNDPVEHDADINLLISKLAFKAALNKRPKRAKRAKNIHFVGSLLADDIPNTYTSDLRSIDDFRAKYGVGNRRLFIWMPGRDDLLDYDFQKSLAKHIKSKENMLMFTSHPWSTKYQKKELARISKIIQHIEPVDTYWAFKSMMGAIGRNTTSGIELAVLRKPILYVENITRRRFLEKKVTPIGFFLKDINDIKNRLRQLELNISEEVYQRYLNKVYPAPFKPAWQRICDFFKGIKHE